MNFLNPIFLWALPLAAVPVLIHLINRRRRRVLPWGAMQFLLGAATRRRRLWRLQDLLLMLLRAALLLIIVLALARPMLREGGAASGRPRDVVLVLDGSLSLAREAGGETLWERQRDAARDLLERLGERDRVRILLAEYASRWLLPAARPVTPALRREIDAALTEMHPSGANVDWLAVIGEALQAAPADPLAVRVVTVLTDGQAYGWRDESLPLWNGMLARTRQTPATLNVVHLAPAEEAAVNLALQDLEISRPLAALNEAVVLTAAVQNTGDLSSAETVLNWRVNDEALGVSPVGALEPGGRITLQIEHKLDRPGQQVFSCALAAADQLNEDNQARAVVDVVEQVKVVLAADQPQASAPRTPASFVLAALGRFPGRSEQRWQAVFAPTLVEPDRLEDEATLAGAQAIVLFDPGELSQTLLEHLSAFVRDGGGLWVLLGPNTDPDVFNNIFYAQGGGLAPLPLDQPLGDASHHEEFQRIQPPLDSHPAIRLLADPQRIDLDRVHIWRHHRFARRESARDIAVLLRNDAGDALAIEVALGQGRIIFQTLPLDLAWGNLAISQTFVVLTHEWLWRLIEPTAPRWNLRPGEPLSAALPEALTEPIVSIPDGRELRLNPGGRPPRLHFTRTGTPGLYSVAGGGEQKLVFQVSRDPRESDLQPLAAERMQALTAAAGLQFVDDPLQGTVIDADTPASRPAWGILLLALLLLLMLETLFGAWQTRRRGSGARGLGLQPEPLSSRRAEARSWGSSARDAA